MNNGRPRVERGADGPPEHEEPTSCTFGELLIGAKFWFEDEQWLKVSVDMARMSGPDWAHYAHFLDNEEVQII